MDPITNLSPSKYVISMDAIDLNYIPTINRYKGSEVTQIWTKRNLALRDNEYFEFEIKEKELKDRDVPGQSTDVQYTRIPCHICNIDVPKQYLKDHFNSKKHKTFKKIINISLDRLKKVMNDEEVFEDSNKCNSVYFCSSCVAVVKINEKILHEKSITHKNSLMVDKILNDFRDLYENDEKTFMNETPVDNSSSHINNVVSWNSEKNPLDDNRKVNDIIKLKEDSLDYSNKSIENKIDKDNNKITPAILELPQTEKNLQTYVDFLINTKYLRDIKVLQNNNLEIKTVSGVKVKILEHHFNSLEKESKRVYRCILCRTNIHKNLKWDHLYEKEHVDLVTIPFENENCFRQFDSCWSHCALCNIDIQNQEEHISNKIHNLHLNEALQIDIVDIKTEAFNINQSNNFTNPLIRKDNDVQTVPTPKQDSKEMERKSVQDSILSNKSKILYKLNRKTGVPEAKQNLEAYVDFLINTTNLKEIKMLQNNYLEIKAVSGVKVKIFEDNFHGTEYATKQIHQCRLCKRINYNNLKWDHLYEKEHVDRVTIPFENENCIRLVDTCWSHCALCNISIQNHEEHILSDKNHKLYLNEALQTNIVNYTTEGLSGNQSDNLNALMCKDDDVQVASTSKQDNTDGEMKTKNKTTVNDVERSDIPKSFLDALKTLTKIHRIDEKIETSEIHYLIGLSDNSSKDFICKVCKTLILNVKEHMNSVHHNESYKKLLSVNNIKEFNKYHFHCKSCDVCFVKTTELIHINNKQHQENLLPRVDIQTKQIANATPLTDMVLLKIDDNLIKDNSFRCAICDLSVPNHNYNIYSHLTSTVHIKAATKLTCDEVTNMHYHIDLTNFPILSCMVCDVSLTLNKKNINTHVNGYIHKQKYKLKLRDNKIVIENNVYSCKICSVSLIHMHELVHCKTKKHIEKLNEIIKSKDKPCDDAESTSKTNNKAKTDLLNLPVKTYLLKKYGNHKELFCLVCNAKVPDNINNIKTHLNGLAHRQLYRSTLEDNSIFNCCGDFECKLCHVVIATGNEFQHISTKAHQDNIKNSLKYNCVVCKVKLTNNDENIRLHNNGEQHKKIMELAFKNDIRIYGDKCFCETCEKVIENEGINEHLKNSIHIMGAFSKDKKFP